MEQQWFVNRPVSSSSMSRLTLDCTYINLKSRDKAIGTSISSLRLISHKHYDVTCKQIYCFNAKNHGQKRGFNILKSMKNRVKVHL